MIFAKDRKIDRLGLNFYPIILEVTNILNSQRNTEGLWKAITGHIKKIVPWERAGITLYHHDMDAFRFYAVETSMPVVRLKCDAIIPRESRAMGWVYDHAPSRDDPANLN
jgi:formate hydrogenlyase transcriptional activator